MPPRKVDLNLFRVFEAIMRHRNIAAAARELSVTPSAVSHALGRLRQMLSDPLFNLTTDGMAPTPRALELAPTVSEGLNRFADALGARAFEPTTSARTFTLGMSDYAANLVLPAIADRLVRTAPNVNLRIFPLSRIDLVERLDSGRLDMAFGWFGNLPPRLGRLPLVIDEEVLIVRKDHPLTGSPLTVERLFAFPYVVVELLGAGERAADGFLDEQGVERRIWIERLLLEQENAGSGLVGRVAVSLPHYSAVAPLIRQSDMVATLPRRLAEREAERETLALLTPPYEPARVTVEAVWPLRSERDAAAEWLVGEVREAVATLPELG